MPQFSLKESLLKRVQEKFPRYAGLDYTPRIIAEIEFVLAALQHLPVDRAMIVTRDFCRYISADIRIRQDIERYSKSNSLGTFLKLSRKVYLHGKVARESHKTTQDVTGEVHDAQKLSPEIPQGKTLEDLAKNFPDLRDLLINVRDELGERSDAYEKISKHISECLQSYQLPEEPQLETTSGTHITGEPLSSKASVTDHYRQSIDRMMEHQPYVRDASSPTPADGGMSLPHVLDAMEELAGENPALFMPGEEDASRPEVQDGRASRDHEMDGADKSSVLDGRLSSDHETDSLSAPSFTTALTH